MTHLSGAYLSEGAALDRELMSELSKQVDPGAEVEFRELLGKLDRDEPITTWRARRVS